MRTTLVVRMICCSLALVVLAGSMGFGTVEHWCQMRGHTKTLLLAGRTCAKTCLSDKADAPVSDQTRVAQLPCCKTTLSYQHLDVSRFLADQQLMPAWQPAGFAAERQFVFLALMLLPAVSAESLPPVVDNPLPRPGRFRLTSLCTWLI